MSAERWVHFANAPIIAVRSTEQADGMFPHGKPKGLWVSDENAENSWSAWCRAEGFRETDKQIAHLVTVSPTANVLRISNAAGLSLFTERYSVDGKYGPAIDWALVATEFAGLLITPYIWECRLARSTEWYYGWDCASGCIWDATAVESVALAEQVSA